jgi:SAM-dependent methyltransferase
VLESCVCTERQLRSGTFQKWARRITDHPDRLHRKLWEWCYIAQALDEHGVLRAGSRGLGFAVGREPLTALFASLGCRVVATDLDERQARRAGWVGANQHAAGVGALNLQGLCPADEFRDRVTFRTVDMRRLPPDLRGFDFAWSSCSIEHLGSIRAGCRFMLEMTRCLRPGGVAVHTTEYNVSSDTHTLTAGQDVLFRRRDLHRMKSLLESLGHTVAPLGFDPGNGPADGYVDEPPYRDSPHLKLRIGPFVSTSIGIIVVASGRPTWAGRHRARLRLLLS